MAGRDTLRVPDCQVTPIALATSGTVVGASETGLPSRELEKKLLEIVDPKTIEVLQKRRQDRKCRGWLVRRLLLLADIVGLVGGFSLALALANPGESRAWLELGLFVASLPLWVLGAKLFGLYDMDEPRVDHSTVDDLVRVCLLVALGGLVLAVVAGYTTVSPAKALLFCLFGAVSVTLARSLARAIARRSAEYVQNTVVVGAGDVGQIVARKVIQHPEYGLNLVGFVDRDPKQRRADLGSLTLLGHPEDLPEIIRVLAVERVIVAFSRDASTETLEVIRSLKNLSVQIDIVPRLFEVVGANAQVDLLEGMPLLGLRPTRMGPSSRLLKRAIDVFGSAFLLALTAPMFAFIAWKIRRGSPGPVFFRQQRLGMDQREFTLLKFRTMRVDADEAPHRDYIKAAMAGPIVPGSNGLFKLDRSDAVTSFGQWLRKTSLDELPQLINVLRGDMSLVGPRPCLAYEVEHFAPHHFERFLVPAGITGLWQVAARAHSNFGDALDIDVIYARSWSPGLDLSLLLRTPLQIFKPKTA
jgi:exopolysaccharide biosynthesis polyprenyl glycosylphosphotransferase